MASRASIGRQMNSSRLLSVLCSALLEWLLMLLLFFNALFSYLVTKFARWSRLQTPCLLCSRLDHVLGKEKPGFYWNLICGSHKSEISVLGYCSVHQKLADAYEMCEGCFLSFGKKNSNAESYVNGDGLRNGLRGGDLAEIPLLDKDKRCSCCFEPVRNKFDAIHLHQSNPRGVDLGGVDILLSTSTRQSHINHQEELSKTMEKSLGSTSVYQLGNHCFDNLPHIGYSEVKVNSDSESEISFSDDADGTNVVHGARDLKEEFENQCLQPEPVTIIPSSSSTENTALEKFVHPCIMLDTSLSTPEEKILVDKSQGVSSLASTTTVVYDSEDLNWNRVEGETNIPTSHETKQVLPEVSTAALDSLEDFNVECVSTTLSGEVSKALNSTEVNLKTGQISDDLGLYSLSHVDLNDAYKLAVGNESSLTSPIVAEVITARDSSKIHEDPSEYITAISDNPEDFTVASVSTTSSGEISKALNSSEVNSKTGQFPNDPCLSSINHMDLNDAYKFAVGNKSSLTSPTVTEVITGRDSFKIHEDLKLLITQISATRGFEPRWGDMSPSPRVFGQGDEYVLQNITNRLAIERNESGVESLDGSLVSEIEGESAVDRLKRQIELDRKSMYLLYKELEEEKSASSIAATQAMAMITRLQEEKAAMEMEALQYQRMMEEQAEYEQEALQQSHELLSQREKLIQNLEAEIERYKQQRGDELLEDIVLEFSCDSQATKNNPTSTVLNKESMVYNKFEPTETGPFKAPLLEFEDEKAYISACLRKLEKQLQLYSYNGVQCDLSQLDVQENGEFSATAGNSGLEHSLLNDFSQENNKMGEDFLLENNSFLSREDSNGKTSSSFSTQGIIETNHLQNLISPNPADGRHNLSTGSKVSEIAALGSEVSHLSERLKALEADRNFLEHTMNSLKNGDDGIRFIQEIACHLRELRRIGFTPGKHTVA